MKIEYDDEKFFGQYAQMFRSREGLSGAGEWHQLKKLFPDVCGEKVLLHGETWTATGSPPRMRGKGIY